MQSVFCTVELQYERGSKCIVSLQSMNDFMYKTPKKGTNAVAIQGNKTIESLIQRFVIICLVRRMKLVQDPSGTHFYPWILMCQTNI